MEHWLTIEVMDGASSADGWRRDHESRLVEAAVTNGAQDWLWHDTRWGLVWEVRFRTEAERDGFRRLPAVTAALDAVPDPVSGLLVYPGRGGSSGSSLPRRPRRPSTSGAEAVPEPRPLMLDLSGS